MKRMFLYALCLMGATCLFSGCSDDDDDDGGKNVADSYLVEYFDELELLQNHLVELDSTGAWSQRINGSPLDDADTTLLFIGVKDIEEAKETFLMWFPDNVDIITMSNNMTVNLKDENRKSQGTVHFIAQPSGTTVNNYPLIADVTFKADIKYVSKVYFIAESSWPENNDSKECVGDAYYWPLTYINYMVIRESSCGKCALLLGFTEPHTPQSGAPGANLATAQEAVKILQQDMELFKILFEEAKIPFNEDDFYWIDKWYSSWNDKGVYAIRPKDGEIDWFTTFWKKPKKRGFQVCCGTIGMTPLT